MKNARILIVENETQYAQDLKYRVETLGYNVLGIVDTGAKAIEFVKRYLPDLVLMDVGLNGSMDGVSAASTIWDKTRTPFVYITAYSEESIMSRLDGAEPYGLVGKPFHDRELQAAIEVALYKAAVEASVRRQERTLKTILNTVRDGGIAIDRHSRITYMNPGAEFLTGWNAHEAFQQEIETVLRTAGSETHQELSICLGIVLREGGEMTVSDIELVTRQNTRAYVDATITAIRKEGDDPEGAAILLHDASERIRVHRESAVQKAFFQHLFDRSPEAIAILDGNDRILDVNRSYTEMFQYSRSDVQGKSVNELIAPRFDKEESEKPMNGETLYSKKDGSTIAVSVLAAPVMLSNETIAVYAIYRDVAEKGGRIP